MAAGPRVAQGAQPGAGRGSAAKRGGAAGRGGARARLSATGRGREHERFESAGAGGGQAAGRKPRTPYPMAPVRTLSRRSQLAATYTAMVSGATTRNGTATTPVA